MQGGSVQKEDSNVVCHYQAAENEAMRLRYCSLGSRGGFWPWLGAAWLLVAELSAVGRDGRKEERYTRAGKGFSWSLEGKRDMSGSRACP